MYYLRATVLPNIDLGVSFNPRRQISEFMNGYQREHQLHLLNRSTLHTFLLYHRTVSHVYGGSYHSQAYFSEPRMDGEFVLITLPTDGFSTILLISTGRVNLVQKHNI